MIRDMSESLNGQTNLENGEEMEKGISDKRALMEKMKMQNKDSQ